MFLLGQLNHPGVIAPGKTESGEPNTPSKQIFRPFSGMNPDREMARRLLDVRLAGLEERIGARPRRGWVNEIRGALSMSTYDLASRMGIGQSRACKIEQAEVEGSIQLRTLGRVALALNCRLVYAFVPDESLQHIVRYQAERKAAEILGTRIWDQYGVADRPLMTDVMGEHLVALAYYLVDRRGLWRDNRPKRPPPDTNNGAVPAR